MNSWLQRILALLRRLWTRPTPHRRYREDNRRNLHEFRRKLRDRIRRKLRGLELEADNSLPDTETTGSS